MCTSMYDMQRANIFKLNNHDDDRNNEKLKKKLGRQDKVKEISLKVEKKNKKYKQTKNKNKKDHAIQQANQLFCILER